VNNVTITLSDEEMTKIKVIDIDELYNFVVDDFFSWNHLVFENVVWSYHNLIFKFKILKQSNIVTKKKRFRHRTPLETHDRWRMNFRHASVTDYETWRKIQCLWRKWSVIYHKISCSDGWSWGSGGIVVVGGVGVATASCLLALARLNRGEEKVQLN
jgi:hypothetical protein